MTAFDLFGSDEMEAINAEVAAQLSAYEAQLRTEVCKRAKQTLVACVRDNLRLRQPPLLQEANRRGMLEAELATREALHREATRRGESR